MTKYSIATACALTLAAVSLTATSKAGTIMAHGKESKPIVEVVKESCITGDIGVAVVSEYISRGVVNENQGLIAQPYLDLYFKLYEGTGFVTSVSLNLGLWASLHSEKTFANPGTRLGAWYEFDWMPGISMTFGKNLTATVSWLEFDFVSSGGRAGSLNLNVSYDDSDLLGAFALHPHVAVLKSFIGNPVGVPGAENAWYFEAGLAPSYTVGQGGTYPITLTVPLTVGLGTDGFYGGQTYGYFSAGINAAVPLSFIPSCYGNWTFSTGFAYYNLGDNAAAASAPAITNGDNDQYVFSGAIGLTF